MNRNTIRNLFKKKPVSKDILVKKVGKRIYFGPFSGLKIPQKLNKVLTVAEILGLYESCLHPKLEYLINRDIKKIILVGGNNGYYSAGLSYIFNPEIIKIYETEKGLHEFIDLWFVENKLSKHEIFGAATEEEFNIIDSKIDLVFMDCEGFEVELLNPSKFSWQKNTNVLLELHPFYVNNLLSTLCDRFRESHEIEVIYDDFNENIKIDTILKGFELDIKCDRHPNHRWIEEQNNKVFTSGIFLFLKRK
jgi:hypothetical protein